MTNTTKTAKAESFTRARDEAKNLALRIIEALDNQDAETATWGHVGNANHAIVELRNLATFLGVK